MMLLRSLPPLHYGPLARINVKKVAPGREGSVHSMDNKYQWYFASKIDLTYSQEKLV